MWLPALCEKGGTYIYSYVLTCHRAVSLKRHSCAGSEPVQAVESVYTDSSLAIYAASTGSAYLLARQCSEWDNHKPLCSLIVLACVRGLRLCFSVISCIFAVVFSERHKLMYTEYWRSITHWAINIVPFWAVSPRRLSHVAQITTPLLPNELQTAFVPPSSK